MTDAGSESSDVDADSSNSASNDAAIDPRAIAASSFAPALIAWQRAHGRQALPWQQLGEGAAAQRDAYRVWLAEIMLQQTQVAAVVPYYQRFVDRFPDLRTLADAALDDVMQHWSGLGYYSRARNLHAAARRVVEAFGGIFPADVEALETLPGVGRSTAGAIAAFAHGRKAAILDGNVKRVLARVFLIEGAPAATSYTRRMWALSTALLPDRDIERYTQGLMDLGATVCTPRNPACLICPFESACLTHRDGREQNLPERKPRKPVPRRDAVLLLVTRGDTVLLERRPATGIWGGLWSLPETAAGNDREVLTRALERHGVVASIAAAAGFVHGFTHFVLHADVVRVRIGPPDVTTLEAPDDALRWVPFDALASVGLPAPIRTLLSTLDG